MSIEKDSFYIRVSCKDSKSVFPLNTCSSFQARLPKELRLGVNWRASLTSIYLPKNIHNIYELMNTITIDKYHDSDMTKDEESFKVSIEPGCYNSPYSLCTSINSALAPTPLKIKFHEKTKRLYFTGADRTILPTEALFFAFENFGPSKSSFVKSFYPEALLSSGVSSSKFLFSLLLFRK